MLTNHCCKMSACGKSENGDFIGIYSEIFRKVAYVLYCSLSVCKNCVAIIRLVSVCYDKG